LDEDLPLPPLSQAVNARHARKRIIVLKIMSPPISK